MNPLLLFHMLGLLNDEHENRNYSLGEKFTTKDIVFIVVMSLLFSSPAIILMVYALLL